MSTLRQTWAIAPFRFDVTPPLGHSLLGGWITPALVIDDPLEGIGYVLLGEGAPIVVCALDWAGLMNEGHAAWRRGLAEAAGTSPDRVAVQCVHQHNTPFVCPEARATAAGHADLPAMYEPEFFEDCLGRGKDAVRAALRHPERVTHVAHGAATVERVASNRRVDRHPDGRVRAMRLSSCTDPALRALPEGIVDPELQTVAFYGEGPRGKIVACHYYATHPMSFYRDGRVTSDFCGLARKRRQREEPGCTHLYFNGCAGDVSAGKYNDGSPAARVELTDRVYEGILKSEQALVPEPIRAIDWLTVNVLPSPQESPTASELTLAVADPLRSLAERLVPAFRLGWLRRFARGEPIVLSRLRVNDVFILHLPGELFVEYQLRARRSRPSAQVAVAGYGDGGPWYVPTKEEYSKGGYETTVAFCRDEVDDIMTNAIGELLA